MKKKDFLKGFFSGAIVSCLFIYLLQNYYQLKLVSDQETFIIAQMELFVVVISSIISTIVAFLVVSFQINKEKEYEEKDSIDENIRYLSILKHESDLNSKNIAIIIKNYEKTDSELVLKKLKETISVAYLEDLYLKIEVNDETFKSLVKLQRSIKLVTSNLDRDVDLLEIEKLEETLKNTSALLKKEIDLYKKSNNSLY